MRATRILTTGWCLLVGLAAVVPAPAIGSQFQNTASPDPTEAENDISSREGPRGIELIPKDWQKPISNTRCKTAQR